MRVIARFAPNRAASIEALIHEIANTGINIMDDPNS
jgi:hypothetical protein